MPKTNVLRFSKERGKQHEKKFDLRELHQLFVDELIAEGRSPKTIVLYVRTGQYLVFAGLDVEAFNSPQLLEMFAAAMPPQWKRGNVVNHLLRAAVFGNWLCRNHYTHCRHHGPRKSHRPLHRNLPTDEEWTQVFEFLAERAVLSTRGYRQARQQHYLICRILFETGIRISECLSLYCDDLRRAPDGKPYVLIRGTKTEASERGVPIPVELAEELRNFRATWHRQRGRLFVSPSGRALEGDCFTTILSKLLAPLELSVPVTPHVFRYNFIMREILRGTSALELMTRLGHSGVDMTIYYFNQVRRLMPFAPMHGDINILERRQTQQRRVFANKNRKDWRGEDD